jgi:hypothetical protein
MFRFTIRELVLLTLVVAMGVGWWLEHRQVVPLQKRCDRLVKLVEESVGVFRRLGAEATFENDNISIGRIGPPPPDPWEVPMQSPR